MIATYENSICLEPLLGPQTLYRDSNGWGAPPAFGKATVSGIKCSLFSSPTTSNLAMRNPLLRAIPSHSSFTSCSQVHRVWSQHLGSATGDK